MNFENLNLNRFGYKVVPMTPEESAEYVSSNSGSSKAQVNNNKPSREEDARNILTGTVITSCFIQTSALPSRVELSGNDARLFDDSAGGGGSISGDSASIKFIRADGKAGALVIQKRHGKNHDSENVFEIFYNESASDSQNNYIFIGRKGDSSLVNFTDFTVLHGVDSVRAEINRIHEYQARPAIVAFDYNKSDVSKQGVVSLLLGEGKDGIAGIGKMAELLTFVSATSFAVGDTITGNVTGATAKIVYKVDNKNFYCDHTSYGVNFTTADNACTTNGAGGGSGTGAFASKAYQNLLLLYTDINLNVVLGNPLIPDTTNAYDLGSPSNKFKDIYLSGSIIGGGGSASGRSGGSGVTSIADTTATKVTMTNQFASGITWDNTNKRFTALVAGKYQVNASVAWQNTTQDKSYYTMIYKNGSLNSYGLFKGSVGGNAQTMCISDIVDLSVGDYVELFCEQTSGGSQSIYNDSQITYLSIALI